MLDIGRIEHGGNVVLHQIGIGRPEHKFAHCIGKGSAGDTMAFSNSLGRSLGISRKQDVKRSAILDLSIERTRSAKGQHELVARRLFINRLKILGRSREVGGNSHMHFFSSDSKGANKRCGSNGGADDGLLHNDNLKRMNSGSKS